ncbi:MAG: restriction endonuclease subunit S [Prosthecobacter sp.]|uniref:restriction endonuclease subunit S n=1 Tax=Prosthecobacter sp. TaxID=1965333 RepID=UPI0038FD3FD4
MEVKPGYKQTEVGVIPEEWECPRIRDAAAKSSNATVGGPFGSDLVSADYVESGVPVIRGQNMSFSFVTGDFVFVSEKKARSLSANLAHPKDLVFTQRGTLGQVAIVPDGSFESYLISQSQMKVSLDRPRHDPHFLHQYFTSAAGQKQIVTSAIQTGVPHTNLGILRAYRFPAPPLPEQRAIVEALSDVDGLLGGLDRLIAKKRDLKQAAMQQLLTGQTRLPGFHGEWEVRRLGEIAKIQRGASPRPIDSPVWFDDSSPVGWVRISDVTRAGMFLLETTQRLSPLGVKHSRPVATGSLIMSICATVGRPIITQIDVCIHDGFVVFDNLEADQRFLYYVLKWIEPDWSKHGQTGSQMNLNTGLINGTRISVPPLPEQTAIATVLSEMDGELAVLEQRREKTRALKQAMMQELLTGRTRLL